MLLLVFELLMKLLRVMMFFECQSFIPKKLFEMILSENVFLLLIPVFLTSIPFLLLERSLKEMVLLLPEKKAIPE